MLMLTLLIGIFVSYFSKVLTVQTGNTAYCDLNGVLFDKNKTTIICYPANKTATSYTVMYSVTKIGSYAFSCCNSLQNLIITDGVTEIGECAIAFCTSLTNVTIGNSVAIIGEGAFAYCSSLTSISIPESVIAIGSYACNHCNSLTSVMFENPNGWWYSDDSTATNGTSFSNSDLSDPATAATYLVTDYYNYYWKRS